MSALCIIPARGGSKRIPRKNIKCFAGLPMIARAITSAKKAEVFDRIIVSTDSLEIADIARDWGIEIPFRRPDHLSDDHATTVDVINHAIKELTAQGYHPKHVCCLYPCTPFTNASIINHFYKIICERDTDYVFPVCEFPSAPQRALKRNSEGRTSPIDPRFELTRTQDLDPAYYDAGQFYWGKTSAWLSRKNVHSHGYSIIVDWTMGIDIDTIHDWQKAELIHHALRLEGALHE
jgi:pseudaminic acid cytidylyltransferase